MQKYSDVVLDKNGKAVQGAVVTVQTYPAGSPATIYAADGGPAVTSVKTDQYGRFSFYAVSGHYSFTVDGTGITPITYNDVTLFDPQDLAPLYALRNLSASVTDTRFAGGAKGDGTTNDAAAIQATIDYVNQRGGGEVFLPRPTMLYNLGATGLTVYGNVVLRGESGRYAGNSDRGVTLKYSGTGSAISGTNVLDLQLVNIDIDMNAATGTALRGVYLNGVWKTTLRNVTVRGMSVAKGYAILFTTNGGAWGGQHNLLEQVECADGIIRLQGNSGSDAVTTTVLNTVRGYMYQFAYAQVVCINATAEQWPDGQYAFDISGAGTRALLLGCDIENTSTAATAIRIQSPAVVREIGTVWVGYQGSGPSRFTGATSTVESNGGAFAFLSSLVANTPILVNQSGDANATYLEDYLNPTNVSGGTQAGHRLWKRLIAGTKYTDHQWDEHAFVKKSISTNATSAQTVWTVPIPSGDGLRLSVHAHGLQAGNNWYSNSRNCNVINAGGTLTIAADTQLSCGDLGAINFTASGANLLVTWTPTTANASTANFNMEIRGPWIGYT